MYCPFRTHGCSCDVSLYVGVCPCVKVNTFLDYFETPISFKVAPVNHVS